MRYDPLFNPLKEQDMHRILACVTMAFLLYAAVVPDSWQALAAEQPAEQQQAKGPAVREPQIAASRHSLDTIAGRLDYTAEAGELILPAEGGQNQARFFYIHYRLNGARKGERPLSFVFNGGPGAASVWLHMGGLGPRIISLHPDGTLPPPPVRLRDNELTWLAFTDLVFVDPVGTGYSRGLGESRPFWGVREDIQSVGEFIRLFLTVKERWQSPLFLVGASYGTTRAAGLAGYLPERYGIWLSGLVLVSPVLDYSTIAYGSSLDLPYALVLPTYAATAAYYGRLGGSGTDRNALLARVQEYAQSAYLIGLTLGDDLAGDDRREMYRQVSAFTGLPEEAVERHKGRIPVSAYVREMFRRDGLVIGRMDTTVRSIDPSPQSPFAHHDPSLVPLFGPFSSAAHAYIRGELGYLSDLPYEFLSDEVNAGWNWSTLGRDRGQGYVDVTGELVRSMSLNPYLRVFAACGRYDLATPYFAFLHSLRQMGLAEGMRENAIYRVYEAGHMPYLHEGSRRALFGDVAAFYGAKAAD
jgi:carboxypeptidase C (cathepsin A)